MKKYKFNPSKNTDEIPSTIKEKKPFMIIAAVFLIFLLIGAGLIWMITQPKKPEKVSDIIVPDINRTRNQTVICDDNCKLEKALNEKNLGLCNDIANSTRKQACYVSLAGSSLDACALVTVYETKKTCAEKHATENKNLDPCSLLNSSDKKSCIEKIEPCYFKEQREKKLCVALQKNNASACEKEDECVYSFSTKQSNLTACGELDKPYKQTACVSLVKKEDVCGDLPLPAHMDFCRLILAKKTNEIKTCEKIGNATTYQRDCYSYFSAFRGNSSVCNNVAFEYRWDCHANFSLETGSLNGCNSIDTLATRSRYACYIDFSKIFGYPSACENIPEPWSKGVCYSIGINNNTKINTTTCRDVQVESWKVRCYTSAAKLYGNSSICSELNNTVDRNFCLTNSA